MSNLIFTICSFNYLGQALSLGQSLKKTNPNYKFVIGLVDRIEDRRDMLSSYDVDIVEIEDVGVKDFKGMCNRYSIVELNTAVKPYFAEYLMEKYQECNNFSYMDPDMKVYANLYPLEKKLEKHTLVLTPHMTSSPDNLSNVTEYGVLKVGIFNLGFIGLSRKEETIRFLRWWQEKLLYECIYDRQKNVNVDQGWVALAPCYFNDVLIWRHKGTNVAYWNLHDRQITLDENKNYYSGGDELLFFHFSGYKPKEKHLLKGGMPSMTIESIPEVKPLFDSYHDDLMNNNFFEFKSQSCKLPVKTSRRKPLKEVLKIKTIATIDKLF